MNNKKISEQFEILIKIYEFRGEKNDFFRIRSFQKVVDTLLNLSSDIEENIKDNKFINKINGLGKNSEDKIIEFINTGKISEIDELYQKYPKELIELTKIQGIGPKTLKLLFDKFQIKNLKDLKKILRSEEIKNLKGMGEKKIQNMIDALEMHILSKSRIPIGKVHNKINFLKEKISKLKEVKKIEIAGSFRRFQETIGDIDILIACDKKDIKKITKYLEKLEEIKTIKNSGETKITTFDKDNLQIDFRLVNEKEFGSALMYFTGNKQHNIILRKLAIEKGYKINEYGLFKGEKLLASETEKQIFNKLGLNYIPPYNRKGLNEIEFAKKNNFNFLIQISDIKGDLHTHTTYSDGKNSIEEMVKKAKDLNYEYIALTDHSQSLKIANGLEPERLLIKNTEINDIQKKYPQIKILKGTETDILKDGSLDYDNKILEQLDIVVASIHYGFKTNYEEKILKAIENKYTNIIGHPTSRQFGKRESIEFDKNLIFNACIKNKVALEINSQGERLDLNWQLAHEAAKAGVMLAINTDSHSTNQLGIISNGVKIAKIAELKKENILNCMKLENLLKFLQK